MCQPQIVGWPLHKDHLCGACQLERAVVILAYDGIDSMEVCNDCIPEGTHDTVAEVFKRLRN